ncbi:MAG: ferrous iron transport protein B [Flavobacteriales bacterium]|jgi:ferrous iron transport protein B
MTEIADRAVRKVALVGNPNTGKSSLFNLLTGLNQHVGNFPGVTVDKREGLFRLPGGEQIRLLDLPGTYSLFPRSADERVVMDVLGNPQHPDHPDLVIVAADKSNLERNLLLFTQLNDIGVPLIVALTMPDMASEKNVEVDSKVLSFHLNAPVCEVNGRTGEGVNSLHEAIRNYALPARTVKFSPKSPKEIISDRDAQIKDTEWRYSKIREILRKSVVQTPASFHRKSLSARLDAVFVHPVWGYLIFVGILMVIFQLIFRFAEYPMEWIDEAFLSLSHLASEQLPPGVFTDLLAEGVIPGIGGVVIFIPQIALLFFMLSLLEESGYMARVVFIMDKLVRPFGLSGKSVVPLVSSVACAIPGVMATRTIASWKDRLITIMVAPLMSCSARLPVFMLMIRLVIPDGNLWGFVDLRGAVLFAMYALGVISAVLIAWIFSKIIRTGEVSFLLMELPAYQSPRLKYVLLHVKEKVTVFVRDAGKVILAISVVLWAMASYGPPGRMDKAVAEVSAALSGSEEEVGQKLASVELENSYIGILGKGIEPVIEPLGYDWKIGIALLTSFAAREVFVGSMATIYSVGEDFDTALIERLRNERHTVTGQPVYTLASGLSLMVFYVYAMQCMSTLAIVRRETGTWKWPMIQLVYMGVLAYAASWLTFIIFSA